MITCKLSDEKTVELDMKGDITAKDYRAIIPQLEQLMKQHGKLKFLILLNELKSFGLGAIYEDIKFDLLHLKKVGTTAIVGNKESQAMLTKFINRVFPEPVKFFETSHKDKALQWLRQS